MRSSRLMQIAALLVVTLVASGSSCPTIPTIKDRNVDLVVGQSGTFEFTATGTTNTFTSGDVALDLHNYINIPQVLSDANIDVSEVKSITLAGVAYRVSVADPTAGRTITAGKVQVKVHTNPMVDLISSFTGAADKTTDWITPTLNTAGVDQLNAMLAAMLTELQGGPAAAEDLTYNVSGTSTPTDVNTNFKYQLRLTLSIVGTVKAKVLT